MFGSRILSNCFRISYFVPWYKLNSSSVILCAVPNSSCWNNSDTSFCLYSKIDFSLLKIAGVKTCLGFGFWRLFYLGSFMLLLFITSSIGFFANTNRSSKYFSNCLCPVCSKFGILFIKWYWGIIDWWKWINLERISRKKIVDLFTSWIKRSLNAAVSSWWWSRFATWQIDTFH